MSDMNLSLTKIVIPPYRKEILSRQRLLDLLYDLVDKKLILLSAPAGYGKTSLLVDLAHHVDLKCCWLSLDILDKEPQRFLSYFITSISRCFPKFGDRSISSLKSLTSLSQGMENFIVTLVNEIYELVQEHFLVIIDDYQLVDDIPFIRDFINRFIQLVGENCHIILSSRTVPSLPDMLSMIAHDQVGGLSLIEMAFQPEEILTLFQEKYGIQLSGEDLEELTRRTEGWITGIYLSRWSDDFSLPNLPRPTHAINVDVYEYLSQQVLIQQPVKLRNFLLHTSLLDEFNEDLCEAVFTDPLFIKLDWKKTIKEIQRHILFCMPVGPDGNWIRYHHLFRDFLQQRMREEYPDRVETILDKAARFYTQHGEWEKAYFLCEQRDDIQALVNLVEETSSLLVQNDRLLTLRKWVDGIPESVGHDRPILLSLKGFMALVGGNPENGLPLLTKAMESFRAAGDIPNLALSLVRIAWAHRLLGDYAASLVVCDEAIKLTMDNDTLRSLHAEAQRSKGLNLFRLGQARQALDWLEGSLAYYRSIQKSRHASMVEAEMGMAYRAIGEYESARNCYENALATLRHIGDLTWQATLLNSMGVLYHAEGQYEKAVNSFEQGLDCARRSGYLDTEALILASLGDLYAEIGDLAIARQTYAQANKIAHTVFDQFLINYLTMVMADLARQEGEMDRAFALLDAVQPAVKSSGSTYEQGIFFLESGRLALTAGNVQQAIWDLQAAIDQFYRGGLVMEQAWTLLWYAAACNEFGDSEAACRHISEALQLVVGKQPTHSLEATLVQVQKWTGKLVERNVGDPGLANLFDRAQKLKAGLPGIRKKLHQLSSAVQLPPPHISVHTLGKARVKINGKLVTSSQWQTQSVRELFFYFFITTKPVSKEKIGTIFWPEISPAQLKLRFKNNIYRLRRAIGQETILFEDNLYRFNTDLDFESDLDQFESELVLARNSSDTAQQVIQYRRAVDLVDGPFLEDIPADWAWHERERVDQQYLHALLTLSRLYQELGNKEEALAMIQRALHREPCLEEAHQLAMQIYADGKDRSAVIRQYRLCQKILKKELGTIPSLETEDVYRQLLK